MRMPGPGSARRLVQSLLVIGLSCCVLALVVPGAADALTIAGLVAVVAAAAVRLPVAIVRWSTPRDRRFLLRGIALVVVMLGGGVLGSLLGR